MSPRPLTTSSFKGATSSTPMSDGLIDEFTVMLRPLEAVQAFAVKMGTAFQAATAGMAGQDSKPDR